MRASGPASAPSRTAHPTIPAESRAPGRLAPERRSARNLRHHPCTIPWNAHGKGPAGEGSAAADLRGHAGGASPSERRSRPSRVGSGERRDASRATRPRTPALPRRQRPRAVGPEGVLHRDRGPRPSRRLRPKGRSRCARRGASPAPEAAGVLRRRWPRLRSRVRAAEGRVRARLAAPAAGVRTALDRCAPVREPQRGPVVGLLRRRPHRRSHRRAGPRRGPARRRAPRPSVQEPPGRRPDRSAARRLSPPGGQRAPEPRPGARDRADDRGRQRIPPVGPQLRGRGG